MVQAPTGGLVAAKMKEIRSSVQVPALEEKQRFHFLQQRLLQVSSDEAQKYLGSRRMLSQRTSSTCSWLSPPSSVPTLIACTRASQGVPQVLGNVESLVQSWQERHLAIRSQPAVRVAASRHMLCSPGACVCSGFAARLWRKARAWIASLNATQLQSGGVVLKWSSFFVDAHEGVTDISAGSAKYTQVALYLRNPFRLILVELQEHGVASAGRPLLKAFLHKSSPRLATFQEWLLSLDPTLAWNVEAKQLSRRCTPVARLNGEVVIDDMDVLLHRLWQGTLDLQPPRRARRRRVQVAAPVAASDSDEAEPAEA